MHCVIYMYHSLFHWVGGKCVPTILTASTNRLWLSLPPALFSCSSHKRFWITVIVQFWGKTEDFVCYIIKMYSTLTVPTWIIWGLKFLFLFSFFLSFIPSFCLQGRSSSGGREARQTTLWWARGYGRPFPPTSKWQTATTSAGTLEEGRCERWGRDRHSEATSHLLFGAATVNEVTSSPRPNLVDDCRPLRGREHRHYILGGVGIFWMSAKRLIFYFIFFWLH